MDPITFGMIVATLASMLQARNTEQRHRENATLDDYIDSLRRHNFDQLVDLIQGNAELSRGIQAVLQNNQVDVLAAFGRVESTLASIAAGVDALRPIGALSPQLPEQVVMILRAMNEGCSSEVAILDLEDDGPFLRCIDGNAEDFPAIDGRFLHDDIALMCSLGLLRYKRGGAEEPIYAITRAGAAVGGKV